MSSDILSGLRVLDFTWVLAGPYATRILADFGAEVIKIQSKKTAAGAESNQTGYFHTYNRNKRSITLDVSFPEAREIVLKLAAISDVAVENFSPRVMANWGLDYDCLKKAKPDLIMVSLSAMGQTGPWKDFVGFGPTVQALSGLAGLTAFTKDAPAGLGFSYADTVAGLYAAFAVLAALEYREKTGRGRYIDLSEYETTCSLLGPALLEAALHGEEILPRGNYPDYIEAAPYGCYPCLGEDRWCVIAAGNEEEWKSLQKVLGRPAWMKEDRFSTPSKRKENAAALNEFLGEWTRTHRAEEVVSLLQGAGIPAGVVQDARDLARDPQLQARNFFVRSEHPVLGSAFTDGFPVKFQDDPGKPAKAGPLLGEDNQYVYRELLGFREREFSSYVERGIIG